MTAAAHRDPLPLDVLDDLLGDLGQRLREDARARTRIWRNASSRVTPWVAARMHLACSIHTRLASARRSWAASTWRLASSTAVRTSSANTIANALSAWTSVGVQARGWMAYTFRVPTGWSASR